MHKQFLKFLKDDFLSVIALIICILLCSFFTTYPIKLIEYLINACFNKDNLSQILLLGGIYFLFQLLQVASSGLVSFLTAKLETKIGHNIRTDLYKKIERLPLAFFDKNSTSDLMYRLIQDSSITVMGVLKPITFLILSSLQFIMGFYFMSSISLNMSLMIVPIGIGLIFLSLKSGPKIQKLTEKQRQASEQLWNKFNEGVKGIKEIKSFCNENHFANTVNSSSEQVNSNTMNLQKFVIFTDKIYSSLFMGIIAFIMVYGGIQVSLGKLSMGGLSALMMYNGMLIDPMLSFFEFYQQMQQIDVSIKKIFSIMNEAEENYAEYEQTKAQFMDSIAVEHVDFSYNDRKVLSDISLTIKKGEHTAFVGLSGSGKSTLCKLIIRLYSPKSGTISMDGRNLENIPLHDLRSICGIVFQDVFLFSGSIRENLCMVKSDASEEELLQIIKIACLDSVIKRLPDGIDTIVGENGSQFSGGERQRIAIAKTLLANPDILILDEATSALDAFTTTNIIQNIIHFYKDKTILLSTHKLVGLTEICDKIFVFQDGFLEEAGTHIELIKNEKLYKNLYQSQLKEETM